MNLLPQQQANRQSKFRNQRTLYGGRWYASKKEATRASELDVLQRVGAIHSWIPQFKIPIEHNGVKICSYYADFRVTYPDGRVEYEDTKGVRTDVYKLKSKLVKAFHGIIIKEL